MDSTEYTLRGQVMDRAQEELARIYEAGAAEPAPPFAVLNDGRVLEVIYLDSCCPENACDRGDQDLVGEKLPRLLRERRPAAAAWTHVYSKLNTRNDFRAHELWLEGKERGSRRSVGVSSLIRALNGRCYLGQMQRLREDARSPLAWDLDAIEAEMNRNLELLAGLPTVR